MAKVNELLTNRLKQTSSKMADLAEKTSQGHLSSFAGVFRIHPLSSDELTKLEHLLMAFKTETQDLIDQDLKNLVNLTCEIKAINNQAAILHGERIKKAQEILKKYRDGAFTAWLISIYGNRQTPYNFLQYYEFYIQLSPELQYKLNEVPRQAIYTLASRHAPFQDKENFLKLYQGQTKNEFLSLIRRSFPLNRKDKRKENLSYQVFVYLKKIEALVQDQRFMVKKNQKKLMKQLLRNLLQKVS